MELIIFFSLVFIAFFTGSWAEKSHYKSIRHKESMFKGQPYIMGKLEEKYGDIREVKLVSGNCVISADRFKVLLGWAISLFGGNVASYHSLLDRARREAIIRMREEAPDADMIICTRIQNSELAMAQVEALAYGTAVYFK